MSIWTRELSLGNRLIDSEHKKLHDAINGVKHSVAARDAVALSAAFEQLENGLRAYFAVEERIAQAVGFDFTQHRFAHRHMLENVRRIRDGLTSGDCSCPEGENLARCLMDCLIKHIKEDGRPLKMVLDTHFYDLSP